MQELIRRIGPNRPHISSDTCDFKERERQNRLDALKPFSAPRLMYLSIFVPPRCRLARLAPRWCISAPPVKGYLRIEPDTRKPFFERTVMFFLRITFF